MEKERNGMRTEEEVTKAYALTAQVADNLQESHPMESASAFVLMRGLAWVLGKEEGEGLYDEMEEEYKELVEELDEDE